MCRLLLLLLLLLLLQRAQIGPRCRRHHEILEPARWYAAREHGPNIAHRLLLSPSLSFSSLSLSLSLCLGLGLDLSLRLRLDQLLQLLLVRHVLLRLLLSCQHARCIKCLLLLLLLLLRLLRLLRLLGCDRGGRCLCSQGLTLQPRLGHGRFRKHHSDESTSLLWQRDEDQSMSGRREFDDPALCR